MAGSTAIDPELVARFKAALDRLIPQGGKIGLAVSGGPDSMAMLLLAHEAIPGCFEVATVDHGLRPEAKDECALVVSACEARGVPCEVLTIEVGEGNVQAQARKARYESLHAWTSRRRLVAIATAHHADDQAETLLMRLNRGSGVAGLAGIRILNYPHANIDDVPVIRPLLEFRRAELRLVLDQCGQEFATDPSNANEDYDRVRIRKALAQADWLDVAALARSASNLADADAALVYLTDRCFDEFVTSRDGHIAIRPPPERELAVRLVTRIVRSFGGDPRGADIARLVDRLARGESGNVGGVLAVVEAGEWILQPEPPRRAG